MKRSESPTVLRRRALGLCTFCDDPAKEGTLRCSLHLEKVKTYYKTMKEKDPERVKTYGRKKAAEWRAAGKCWGCGEDVVEGRTGCRVHLDLSAEKARKRTAGFKAKGLCVHCGGSKGKKVKGKSMCKACLKYMNDASVKLRKVRRVTGQCFSCGKPRPEGRASYCMECQPTRDGHTNAQKQAIKKERYTEERQVRQAARMVRNAKLAEWLERPEVPIRTAAMMVARFGIGELEDRTLNEVGQMFGITRERVRQIVDAELKRMEKGVTARGRQLHRLGGHRFGYRDHCVRCGSKDRTIGCPGPFSPRAKANLVLNKGPEQLELFGRPLT